MHSPKLPVLTFAIGLTLGVVAYAAYGLITRDADRRGSHAGSTLRATALPQTGSNVDQSANDNKLGSQLQQSESSAGGFAKQDSTASAESGVDPNAQRWRQLEKEIDLLSQRVVLLEHQFSGDDAGDEFADANTEMQSHFDSDDLPTRRKNALVESGVKAEWAADIVSRQNQRSLDRLEIRDQAIREGWFGSERYVQELRSLSAEAPSLRSEIGDESYDRYLHAMGEPNRIMIDSVIPGSSAEAAGIMPGDVIVSYADERLFSTSELRTATTQGERGENVRVRVTRGSNEIDLYLPRGPMGVQLDTTSVSPE